MDVQEIIGVNFGEKYRVFFIGNSFLVICIYGAKQKFFL